MVDARKGVVAAQAPTISPMYPKWWLTPLLHGSMVDDTKVTNHCDGRYQTG